jgi:hypothetical protein
MEDLWEDNIKELLAWAGYHKTLEQLTPQEAQALHQQVQTHFTTPYTTQHIHVSLSPLPFQ